MITRKEARQLFINQTSALLLAARVTNDGGLAADELVSRSAVEMAESLAKALERAALSSPWGSKP